MGEGLIPAQGAVLGVDPGTKRVGIAVAGVLGIVHPLGFLNAEPQAELMRRIAALAADRECVGIVVGLPLNMDSSEGPAVKAAHKLGAEIARVSGLPVEYADERLTSWEAEHTLLDMGLTRRGRKRRVDALAAAGILQGFLAERAHRSVRPPEEPPPSDAANGPEA